MIKELILKLSSIIAQITSNGFIDLRGENYEIYKNACKNVCYRLLTCENNEIMNEQEEEALFDFLKLSEMYSAPIRTKKLIDGLKMRYNRLKCNISVNAPQVIIDNEKLIIFRVLDEIISLI